MTRIYHIDALKGIAIVLVVLGHTIQEYVPLFDNNLLFRWIYSFHMPLFMFLAGFVAFGRDVNLKKKFFALVVPFISWYQVAYLYQSCNAHHFLEYIPFITKWILSPDYGLWFLWILFVNFCMLKIQKYITHPSAKFAEEIIFVGIYFLLQAIPIGTLGIGLVKVHFLNFGFGYFFAKYRQVIPYKKILKIIILVTAPIVGLSWYRLHPPTIWSNIMLYATNNHFHGIWLLFDTYQKIVVPLLGIGFTYILVPKKGAKFYNYLCVLGKNTLGIYAIHTYFLGGFGAGYLRMGSAAVEGIVVSLIISLAIKKSKFLSRLFLGAM